MKPAFVIIFTILGYILATDIYTPSLPLLAAEFKTDSDAAQATVSIYLLGALLACVLGGLFSEYIGNKKILLSGLSLAIVGIFICLFSTDLEGLIIGRFIQGFGSAAAPVIGFSMIQELYSEKELVKIYAWIGIVLAGSPAFAPALGGYFSMHLGWRFTFIFILAILLIGACASWKVLPQDMHEPPKRSLPQLLKSYITIFSSRQFMSYAIISPAFNCGEWFMITFLPFYFQKQIGLSAQDYGWTVGFLLLWFSAGSYLSGKIVNYRSIDQTITYAIGLGFFSSLSLFLVCIFTPYSLVNYMIFISIYMTAFGMIFPTSVTKAMATFKDMKTRSSSVRFTMITSFAFIGSGIAEYCDDTRIINLPIFLLITCFIALIPFKMRHTKSST